MNSLENLVGRAARNDEGAFEELYKRYYKSVYYAAMKLCKSEADAQDIAQLTFIKVRRSIHTLQKPEYFPLWLNRICINVAKNFFRKNKEVTFDNEYIRLHNQAIEKRPEFVTQTYWHKQNDVEVFSKLIDELKPEHREILMLFYFQNKSYEVISADLHMPEGTVKSRLYYARNELKKRIENYEAREEISLDFKEETICAAIMVACLAKQVGMIPKLGYSAFFHRFVDKLPKTTAVKVSMATSLSMATVVVIGYASHVDDQVHVEEASKPLYNQIENHSFNTIDLESYTIDNEVDAYYLLINWGFDKQALEKKSREDLQKMQPLYEELKKQNGLLYQVLKEQNWTQNYEELSK